MRLRKWRLRGFRPQTDPAPAVSSEPESIKTAEPVGPDPMSGLLRKVINNPEFPVQLMMVMLTMSSGNIRMDRRIDSMNTTIDTVRNVTNLLTNTMQSLKSAAEAPKQIRRMLQ
ncbi:MAG: hypothetical protein E6X17_16480 [Sporomusaceae bacterium]|nr:hypothetical protein [Sporomusaceae bacterium]